MKALVLSSEDVVMKSNEEIRRELENLDNVGVEDAKNTLSNHDTKLSTYKAMLRYGGGFVSHLAEAMIRADSSNLDKIATAWPEYINKYSNWPN